MSLRFDDKVAVITGAGGGLGRAYALLLASRGAKVVVNDLGGDRHGSGQSSNAADSVVEEIIKAGGIAAADYNSVANGEKIIQTAVDKFGKIDILINNAGVLRDRAFARIPDKDWEIIQDVHVVGSFKTTRAAFPIFKKQGFGRIIMTSSNAGLYGNYGQANYSAAKMAVIGLSNTIAIEGYSHNICCNVIVPTSASRLTQDIFPPEMFEELKPELIAPIVAYLCHETCRENGAIIESAAGWAGKCHISRANGALVRKTITDAVTIENVHDKWPDIVDLNGAKQFNSIHTVTGELLNSLEVLRNNKPIPESDSKTVQDIFKFTSKDLILYALGVGASVENPEELKFLYENHENFCPLPSYFILPSIEVVISSGMVLNDIPGKKIGLDQVLHGEQYLELTDDCPCEGVLLSKANVVEVLDKGSGAVIVTNVETFNEEGRLAAKSQIAVFAVGAGKFGGSQTATKLIPCVDKPNRNPDKSVSYTTSIDQAALYRLSGDINPLHIDPNFAAIAGYDRPILHGMCTLGISIRIILGAYANYDFKLFKALKVRFTKPLLPGQTIRVDMWREGNRIHFETLEVSTKVVVIGGAYADLKAITMGLQANKLAATNLLSDAIFETIIERVKQDPAKAKSVNGVFLVKITKNGQPAKEWTMDLKTPDVYEGNPKEGKPNTTLILSDEVFLDLALGKINAQQAFMKQKLKISGNIVLAQKLAPLLQSGAKL